MKYEDDIHNATNDRLAEMLEPIGLDIALNNPQKQGNTRRSMPPPPHQTQGTFQQ